MDARHEDGRAAQKHRGFAFIEFESSKDAAEAVDNMHLAEICGKVIKGMKMGGREYSLRS